VVGMVLGNAPVPGGVVGDNAVVVVGAGCWDYGDRKGPSQCLRHCILAVENWDSHRGRDDAVAHRGASSNIEILLWCLLSLGHLGGTFGCPDKTV